MNHAHSFCSLRFSSESDTPADEQKKSALVGEDGLPMVCTMVRGTIGTIELAYRKINQDVPILVLKGTGSAADLVAFAYEEISAK